MRDVAIRGRYRLRKRLATGGMADIYAAEDLELGRPVAVKLLGPGADPERFEREARAVAALDHPNVVRVYDYGAHDGRPFMVLELLPGGSLDTRLANGRALPNDQAERIARELAAGLAHAHARGLVHRDLKPANVLFDGEGRAKIADFGIARLSGAEAVTEPGTILGSALTMSPEQAAGEAATPASDVYSFAVVLFRMLTGRYPFEAEDPLVLARMHRELAASPVRSLSPDAPPALAALAEAAMAKDPGQRPADGSALQAALGTQTEATLVLQPPKRRRRSRAWPLAAALMLLALAGGTVAVILTHSGSGSTPASKPSARVPTRTRPTSAPPVVPPAEPKPSQSTSTTAPTTATTTEPETTAAETTTATTEPETTQPETTVPTGIVTTITLPTG